MAGIGKEYLLTVLQRFKYYKSLAEKTFEQLQEKDFHFQPSPDSNSISIIIQHMAGNMLSRFTNFLTEDGEKDWRQRDAEFEDQKYSKDQLLAVWEKGWECFFNAVEPLQKKDLLKNISIRQEPLTVLDAINRQLAHYTYHVGQIITIGKMIRDKEFKSLSIPKGHSKQFNSGELAKDPAKKM